MICQSQPQFPRGSLKQFLSHQIIMLLMAKTRIWWSADRVNERMGTLAICRPDRAI